MKSLRSIIFCLSMLSIFVSINTINTYAGNVKALEIKKQAEIDKVTGPSFANANNEEQNKVQEEELKKPSRGALIGEFKATAYTREEFPDNQTATGIYPTSNHTIASDWRILAPGTKVMIGDSETIYVVEDCGVKGHHIDIFMETNKEARIFGVQKVKVYLVNE